MARRIRLTLSVSQDVNWVHLGAYRMRVTAADAEGLDARVFLFRRDPVSPYTNDHLDTFFAVASPVDMEEFPPEEPDPLKAYPFFRRDSFELDLRNVRWVDITWGEVKDLVGRLIEALDRLEDLTAVDEAWIPSAPELSLSASET